MGSASVILFPLGAVIIGFLNNLITKPALKHEIVQIVAMLVLFAGGGFGFSLIQERHFTKPRKRL
jgi:hypothetical protein